MAAVFSKTTKLLLHNVIRHTNAHNKVVEESEMWQQYERLKDRGSLDHSHPAFLHDDRCGSRKDHSEYHDKQRLHTDNRRHRLAHMDEVVGNGENYASGSSSTYWMRQLEKAKAADPNRWDHSGFKELYPDVFDSDRSRDSSTEPKKRGKKRKRNSSKQKTEKSAGRLKIHQNKSKKSKKKKKRRKSTKDSAADNSNSSTSDLGDDSSQEENLDRKSSIKQKSEPSKCSSVLLYDDSTKSYSPDIPPKHRKHSKKCKHKKKKSVTEDIRSSEHLRKLGKKEKLKRHLNKKKSKDRNGTVDSKDNSSLFEWTEVTSK